MLSTHRFQSSFQRRLTLLSVFFWEGSCGRRQGKDFAMVIQQRSDTPGTRTQLSQMPVCNYAHEKPCLSVYAGGLFFKKDADLLLLRICLLILQGK